MNEHPLVTVFTLIYDTNPDFIIEAIESVRANGYPNIQHLIIDDCSPNVLSKDMVKEWIVKENYTCEFYEHDTNLGISRTMNNVLKLAKGKYLIGCCDDVLVPDRIYGDVQILEGLCDNFVLVFGMAQEMDSKSNLKFNVFPNISDHPADNNYFEKLIYGNFLVASSVTLRTESVRRIGGYDVDYCIEDYPLWLKFAHSGYKFATSPLITSYYRIHNDNITKKLDLIKVDLLILLKYRDDTRVRRVIEEKLLNYGIYYPKYFLELLGEYRKFLKPNMKLNFLGLQIPGRLKMAILSFWS